MAIESHLELRRRSSREYAHLRDDREAAAKVYDLNAALKNHVTPSLAKCSEIARCLIEKIELDRADLAFTSLGNQVKMGLNLLEETRMKKLRNQRGMTLIEIMIVLIILGSLLAVLGRTVMSQYNKSRVQQTRIVMGELQKALDQFNADCGFYPTTDQTLAALTAKPAGRDCASWGPEPYLKKIFQDAWKHDFNYDSDGSKFVIRSLGQDGREGGEGYAADISSEDL